MYCLASSNYQLNEAILVAILDSAPQRRGLWQEKCPLTTLVFCLTLDSDCVGP